MNLFSHAPFIRVLPAFVAGVALSFFSDFRIDIIESIFIFSILSLIIWVSFISKFQYKFKYVGATLLLLSFFSFGFLLQKEKAKQVCRSVDSEFVKQKFAFATVLSIPDHTGKSMRVQISVETAFDSISHHNCRLKSYFYYGDSLNIQLNVGDKLLLQNKIKPILPPANPGQFDFQYYSSLKRISSQYRLKNDEWKIIEKNKSFSIYNLSKQLRDQLLNCYKRAGIEGQEYAVISALVLGYDDEIDQDLMRAFSASGTLHILSVSGMHVGIVFSILAFLFRKLEKRKGWWLVRLVSMIIIIWFYALLTGLSPSVIRSAMMFMFILIGKSINRNSNIYNTLAASILVISICFDPLLLFEPGFQLSYLAVAGIAFLYKPIYHWWYVKNKFIDAIWNLTAVSIAAQLATFPVSLYYFHQFPNYFIPANLLIIPVSTIAIFGGLALLVISPWAWLSIKFGILLKWTIDFLNFLAFTIKDLPYAVTDELYLSFIPMMVLYLFLLLIIFYLLYRSMDLLRQSVMVLLLFILIKNCEAYLRSERYNVIVYSSANPTIEVIEGRKTFLYFPKQDSIKSFKLSNDMHTYYQLSKNDRVAFGFDSIGSEQMQKIGFTNFTFSWKAESKAKTISFNSPKGDTLQMVYSIRAPKGFVNLRKKAFVHTLKE